MRTTHDLLSNIGNFDVSAKHCVYVLVITPLPVIWRVYMHDARGRAAHEGGVHIYQPDHEEGVL